MNTIKKIICWFCGHDERRMNKTVKPKVSYVPVYCVRCNAQWREDVIDVKPEVH